MSESDQPTGGGGPSRVVQLREAQPQQPQQTDADFLARVVEQTVQQIQARVRPPSPFDLTTFDDVIRFAEHVTNSGICPKQFQGKPDDAIVAVLWGKELGLPPMSALTSIAVVNGNPALWGDAVAGVCLKTGLVQDVTERFEGTEGSDDYTAYCVVTRKGFSPREGRFSAADVRRAGLKNVHIQYPRDMMMWRARHRAWHAAFPDTLKGMGTAEIAQEEAAIPAWEMPRPERSWQALKPQYNDGWDVAWFNRITQTLLAEPNAWRWMETLVGALKEAPTLRDVDELESLPMVAETMAKAPEEAKASVAACLAEARQRFAEPPPPDGGGKTVDPSASQQTPTPPTEPQRKRAKPRQAAEKPAQTKAPLVDSTPPAESKPGETGTPAQTTTAFEYCILDQYGELASETLYTDPIAWARAFWDHHERSASREAIREHNADALVDARQDSGAELILAGLEDEPQTETEETAGFAAIELPMERGRPNSNAYVGAIKEALAQRTQTDMVAWLDAQRATIDTVAQSVRMLVIKLIAQRFQELSLPAPEGFAPAASQAEKDGRLAEAIIDHLDSLTTEHAVRAYSNEATVMVPLKRWRSENPALATSIESAFAGRIEAVKAGG